MPKICQGNFCCLPFPQKWLFNYTWWHWVHIRGRHLQWLLKKRVFQVHPLRAVLVALPNPCAQKPWQSFWAPPPHTPSPGEKQTHQTWICKSLWITVWGAENVLSFSLAGPLVPIAMGSLSLTFIEHEGSRGWFRYKDDTPGPCMHNTAAGDCNKNRN